MDKIRIGIICPSDIANRRFLPALAALKQFEFCGVGINSVEERYGTIIPPVSEVDAMRNRQKQRAETMISEFGGKLFESYAEIVESPELDALYIPLPPALHYKWAKMAFEAGKHVLVEKPSTTELKDTRELITIAEKKHLAFHENYMFIFHDQLSAIQTIVDSGKIGDVRLYRISFGFPMRALNDFRYDQKLGGGSLLDAGGYTIKYASYLLGNTAKILYARMNSIPPFEVDMFGSGALINDEGITAQIAFGMDNDYKCELEIWGSKGTLTTGRVLTAPAGFVPTVKISMNGKDEIVNLPADDAFKKSIKWFLVCMEREDIRKENYKILERQARLVEDFMRLARM